MQEQLLSTESTAPTTTTEQSQNHSPPLPGLSRRLRALGRSTVVCLRCRRILTLPLLGDEPEHLAGTCRPPDPQLREARLEQVRRILADLKARAAEDERYDTSTLEDER